MPGSAENPGNKPAESESLSAVLRVVAQRLNSQPMLFGLGILLLLVIVGGVLADQLSILILPALVIFIVGALGWLIIELPKARAAARPQAPTAAPTAGIEVHARGVGEKGTVIGIEGLPPTRAVKGQVKISAEDIQGNVRGARYARSQEDEGE